MNVSDPVKSTNMPEKSTKSISSATSDMTLDMYMQTKFPMLISSLPVSHARLLALLDKDWASMTREERYFLKLLGLRKKSDLKSYSCKMLKDSLITTKDEHSEQSSIRYMNWGMMSNGKLLTGNISFHKTERESSLSDILEPNPQQKYFLSPISIKSMIKHYYKHKAKGNGFGVHILEQLMQTTQKPAEVEQ